MRLSSVGLVLGSAVRCFLKPPQRPSPHGARQMQAPTESCPHQGTHLDRMKGMGIQREKGSFLPWGGQSQSRGWSCCCHGLDLPTPELSWRQGHRSQDSCRAVLPGTPGTEGYLVAGTEDNLPQGLQLHFSELGTSQVLS